MVECLKKFDYFLKICFEKLARAIGDHTGYFIIVPLLLTALLGTGLQRIVYESDPEYLFAPTNGPALRERAVVEEFFSSNASHDFNRASSASVHRHAKIIVVAKDRGTMLRETIWKALKEVDDLVHNISVHDDGHDYKYKDLCSQIYGQCVENNILNLEHLIPRVENKTYRLPYPLFIDFEDLEKSDEYVFPFYFGGVIESSDKTIDSVEAVALYFKFQNSDEKLDRISSKFENNLKDAIITTEFDLVNVTVFTSETLRAELENNTNSIIPYFGVAIGIMIIFCIAAVSMGDCVRGKTLLGLAGILCSALACVASFGLLAYLGSPFIGINLAAPFLMLGIGIDDTFVMLAAWRRTSIQAKVSDRLVEAYSDAAVSITNTSLTNVIAFFIGAITPFPSVQIFSIYTGTAVLMTYLWHITLFGGLLAASGYAEKKQLHNVVCIPVKAKSLSKDEGCGYRLFCSGGISEDNPTDPEDNKDHFVMVIFRDYVAKVLNKTITKVFVLFIYLTYLSVAIYGCFSLEEGLERKKLSRYDSYSVDFYAMDDKYFRMFPYRIQMIVSGNYSYHDPEFRDQVRSFLEEVEEHRHVYPLLTESWLRKANMFEVNSTSEASYIADLKAISERYPKEINIKADVIFSPDGSRIVASRFMVQAYNMSDPKDDQNLMTELRELAARTSLNVTFYNPFFIFFDQFTMVRSITIQSVSVASVIMMLVSLVFIPNPLCSVWVGFSIISIEVGVIGFMSLWNVNLDSISMIQLIMCIGFSVDFSAHISYAYLAAKANSPDERVRESLYGLGLPILQGALSTILGILTLYFAPSYIFRTFFKTVFLVVLFGAFHGLFLLPVLLSYFGPGSACCGGKSKEQDLADTGSSSYVVRNMYGQFSYMPHQFPPQRSNILASNNELHIPRPRILPPATPNAITNSAFYSENRDSYFPKVTKAAVDGCTCSTDSDQGIGTSSEESAASSLRDTKTKNRPTNSLANNDMGGYTNFVFNGAEFDTIPYRIWQQKRLSVGDWEDTNRNPSVRSSSNSVEEETREFYTNGQIIMDSHL